MAKFFSKLHKFFVASFAPTFRCVICGADVFDGSAFCARCLKDVVFNNGKTCKRCGVALHGAEDYCGRCVLEKTYFDRCFSPFCYGGNIQRAILNMKFHNVAMIAESLAPYLVDCAKQNNLHFDMVTFVPMTKKSQKRRGYNQARLLAEHFCAIMELGEPSVLLQKVKETVPQEKLGKKEREVNLDGAFVATEDLKGKTILVIDDIKTTGATLNMCAKALKRKGAAAVFGLTVASREEHVEYEIQSQP